MKLTNKERRIFLKVCEELSELSYELLHAVNKHRKENWDDISAEIEDVEKWLRLLKGCKK